MAQAIAYCDRCGRLIPPSEVEQGLVTDRMIVCPACTRKLSPEERALIAGPATAPPPAARKGTTTRLPASRRQASTRRPAAAPQRPGRASAARKRRAAATPARDQGAATQPRRRPVTPDGRHAAAAGTPEADGSSAKKVVIVMLAAGSLAGLALGALVVTGRKRRPSVRPAPGPAGPRDGGTQANVPPRPTSAALPGTGAVTPPPLPALPGTGAGTGASPAPSRAGATGGANSARERLDEIAGWKGPSLRMYDRMRDALEAFPRDFPAAPEAGDAARLLAEVDAEYEKLANDALASAKEAARALSARGEHNGAVSVIRSVRRTFESGYWLRTKGDAAIEDALRELASSIGEEGWLYVKVPADWSVAGDEFKRYDGTAWYRCFVEVPADWEGRDLRLELGAVDDADVTFFNGAKVGSMDDYSRPRDYPVAARYVRAGGWNMIAVRVQDYRGGGGITPGPVKLSADPGGSISLEGDWQLRKGDYVGWAKWPADPESDEGKAAARAYRENAGNPVGRGGVE